MKIIYLTWGETPRSIGVFGSQVLGQFSAIIAAKPSNEYHLVCGVPLVHSGLVREKWRYPSELRRCASLVKGASFFFLILYAPQNLIYSAELGFRLLHAFAHNKLRKIFEKIQPDIIHCRSYHAAWAALQVREKYRFSYKIIFDGRDLWPEVVALKSGWNSEDHRYKYLKLIEKTLLARCEASVSVSKPMEKQYVNLGSSQNRLINVSADTRNLHILDHEYKLSNYIRFCYVGALAEGSWHDTKSLVKLYRHLRSIISNTKLTIVTTSDHIKLKKTFSEFPDNEIIITSHRNSSQLKEILKSQDFGILSYFTPVSKLELTVSSVVLAVKVAEYLSAGLPIICNGYCTGTAELIKDENNLGIVYWPERISELTPDAIRQRIHQDVHAICRQYAVDNFDINNNAIKYQLLYSDLMSA